MRGDCNLGNSAHLWDTSVWSTARRLTCGHHQLHVTRLCGSFHQPSLHDYLVATAAHGCHRKARHSTSELLNTVPIGVPTVT